MEKLDELPAAAELYDYRQADGGGVPLWLPHNQGDVFRLGPEDDPSLVMLFMHPCTMRVGHTLRSRATVIDVRRESPKKSMDQSPQWATRYAVVPLPDFSGNGKDAYYDDLLEIHTIDTALLSRVNRVAALSDGPQLHAAAHDLPSHQARGVPAHSAAGDGPRPEGTRTPS